MSHTAGARRDTRGELMDHFMYGLGMSACTRGAGVVLSRQENGRGIRRENDGGCQMPEFAFNFPKKWQWDLVAVGLGRRKNGWERGNLSGIRNGCCALVDKRDAEAESEKARERFRSLWREALVI